jgi:CPA2 family monovalent cation:H+ antiporter-2
MHHFTILLTAAAIAFGLSRLLRLPPIPLLMLSGIALRAGSEYLNVEAPEILLGEMIEIGLAVLVFTSGVDLSPKRMRDNARGVLIVAVVQFIVLGIAGIVTALLLDYNFTNSLYLGFALSASSTLIVVQQLQKRQKMFVPFGRLVLGVLLIQDLFIILLMVALLKLPDGIWATIGGITGTVALGLVAWLIHKRFIPWATTNLKLDEEELMLGALSMLFAFSGVAYLMGLPFLVGSFFAGFTLSAFPMNGLVRGMLSSLSGFFLAIFFISIGTMMVLPDIQLIQHSLIFIIVLVLVTIVLVTTVAELVGYSTRASIETALLLSQTSEFSLMLAYSGMASGLIPVRLFSMIVLITVSTMTLTPFIARRNVSRLLMKLHPRYRRGEVNCSDYTDHAVMLGFGRAGAATLQLLL